MLEEIRVFVTVVQAGSFTQAADTLDLSRSVISKKISALESSLGVQLLNRTTRRLSLTEAGELFYQHSRSGLGSIEEAVNEVSSLNTEPRGRLYINLPMSFGVEHIAPLIPEFLKRYPGVRIDMNFDDRKVDMIDPGFDVSIRVADLKDSSLAARRLGPCHHLIVASEEYLKTYGKPCVPNELSSGHHIANYRLQDSALEWIFVNKKSGDSETIHLDANITVNNGIAQKHLVLGGSAIARMPTFLIGREVANGKLVNLFPEFYPLKKSIFALFPKREYMPAKTRLFIDFLVEKISDPPLWDKGLDLN